MVEKLAGRQRWRVFEIPREVAGLPYGVTITDGEGEMFTATSEPLGVFLLGITQRLGIDLERGDLGALYDDLEAKGYCIMQKESAR